MWLSGTRVSALAISLVVGISSVGCSIFEPQPSVPRVLPAQVLQAYDLQREMPVEEARQAQRDVRRVRTEVGDGLLREQIACYRRFLVNRCLREVAERQRIVEARVDAVEVMANRSVRQQAALETSERLAQDEARRAQDAQQLDVREQTNRSEFEARQQAAAKAQAQREADAPELERRAARLQEESLQRQRDMQLRIEQAERRAAEDQARVAARERTLEAQRLKELERQRRDAERDARPGTPAPRL
jgi:hypothetical protein